MLGVMDKLDQWQSLLANLGAEYLGQSLSFVVETIDWKSN
jgi:hypothetical protein